MRASYRLALRLDEALAVAVRHTVTSCTLQEDFVTLDVEGNVTLCCATTGRPSNIIGNYLDMPLADIQAKRQAHPLCGPCMKTGGSYYYTQQDLVFDTIGAKPRAVGLVKGARTQELPLLPQT